MRRYGGGEEIDLRDICEVGTGLAALIQCSFIYSFIPIFIELYYVPENIINGNINMSQTGSLHSVNTESKRSNK